jgi:putative ABC transport system permease protein
MSQFLRRFRQLLRWRQFDRDLAEEMAFHRDMAAQEGDPGAFGSAALAADQARDVWIPVGLRDLNTDIRFALRLLLKERAFTFAAVLTLALAIGINSTVYTVINAMILRGLPVAHPDRIVMAADKSPAAAGTQAAMNVSYRDVEDWRAATSSFDEIGLFAGTLFTIGDDGHAPDAIGGSFVSWNIFRVVQEHPIVGRDFLPADEQPGAAPVVMLGHTVWTSRYGSDPSVIGRRISVNFRTATIIGVMPPGFRFPLVDDLWMPVSAMAGLQRDKREVRPFRVCGRLRADTSMRRANAELDAVTERLAREYPATNRTFRAALLPFTGTATHPMYLSLLGAVLFVLLIACANVSNLLLARSHRRSHEIAMRTALGASRWRVVRQLLIESLLLASIAGLIGFMLSIAGVRAFAYSVSGINFPYWYRDKFTMDGRVFAFVGGVCLASAFLFGLVPALQLSRRDVQNAVKQDARTSAGRSHMWANVLLAGELAFALVLLVGAGLMMRSFLAVYRSDITADAAQVVTVSLRPPAAKVATADQRLAFFRRIEERLRANPSLAAVTFVSSPPFVGAPMWQIELGAGRQSPDDPARRASIVTIDRGYFETLGVRLLRGRLFTDDDGTSGHEAAIVNQQFVTMIFGGVDPIGQRVCASNPDNRTTAPLCAPIVGVSPTVRQQFMTDLDPVIYFPLRANPIPGMFMVRSADLRAAAEAVRSEVQAIEPDTILWRFMPLETWMEQSRWGYRVFGTMFSVFAAIALVLSAVGIYAVTAYSVVERTREIGIRVALGAPAGRVIALFLRRKVAAVVAGVLLGVGGAFGVGQLIRSMLVQTSPTDAVTLTSLAGLLVAVATAAVVVPALRATRIEPTVALRHE